MGWAVYPSPRCGQLGSRFSWAWLQLIGLRENEHPADVLGPQARVIKLTGQASVRLVLS
jgi:hypothetical protein